jgi:hypothetical protein
LPDGEKARIAATSSIKLFNKLFLYQRPTYGTGLGYAYRWMKPEVYLEVPDKRQLEKADPITYQLLGGYRDIDTPPWALQQWAKRHGVLLQAVPWTVEV